MKKEQRTLPVSEYIPMNSEMDGASTVEAEKRKSQTGFLYLFVALAKRVSSCKGVLELQDLSGLIEAEIKELQNNKSKLRVRDVLRTKW
jgi:hypothetical protein